MFGTPAIVVLLYTATQCTTRQLGYAMLFIEMLYSQCHVMACWVLRCTFPTDNAGPLATVQHHAGSLGLATYPELLHTHSPPYVVQYMKEGER